VHSTIPVAGGCSPLALGSDAHLQNMTFKFQCNKCGQRIEATDDLIGTVAACPSCGDALTIPSPPRASDEAVPLSATTEASRPPSARKQLASPHSGFTWGTPKQAAAVGAALLIVAILLGFFHIVSSETVTIIPKEHFTYSMTFISLDNVLTRYNERSIGSSMRGNALLDHLVEELGQRHLVSERKRTWNEVDEKVRQSLPEPDPAAERELARTWKQMQDQGVTLNPYAKEVVDKYYPADR
jgi:rRNA maturation protein Nop10